MVVEDKKLGWKPISPTMYDVGLIFVGESIVGVEVIYYKDTVVLTISKHHHIYILNMEMGRAANGDLLLVSTGIWLSLPH